MTSDLTRVGPLDVVSRLAVWDATSLALPPDMAIEDWQELGTTLGQLERSAQWWLGDWRLYGDRYYGSLADQADTVGVDYDTLNAARWVAERIEVVRRRTTLSWSHHREVAALSPDEQDEWLDRAETEGLSRNDLRTAIRRGRVSVGPSAPLPAGKYRVLLADPPWRYDFIEADNRAIENQYPTLTAAEIEVLADADGRTVADLPADDAVLFLWATNPKLGEILPVIEAWGFTYVTNLVWVKDRIGMGYWARQRHELVLVCRRGDMAPPPEALRPDSVIEAPRGRHSEKPDALHEFIESVWPDEPKIELFARTGRPGWATWGNQA